MKQSFPLPSEAATLAARLSSRQRECLLLVKEGLTSKEIGRLLSLSPSTVDNHLNAAIERLGCSSRAIGARILETAEQFQGKSLVADDGEVNASILDDPAAPKKPRRSYLLPPLGGSANEETTTRRIAHIGLIAIAATMAFAAITLTIAGAIRLFSG